MTTPTEADKALALALIEAANGDDVDCQWMLPIIAAFREKAVAEAVGPLEKELANAIRERDEMGQKLSHALSEERDTFYFNEKVQDKLASVESARDTLAAPVVRLKSDIDYFFNAKLPGIGAPDWHENPLMPADQSWNKRLDVLKAALDAVPADLADSVVVKRSEWATINESLRIASMNHKATLEDLIYVSKEGGDARVRNADLKATVSRLEAELARVRIDAEMALKCFSIMPYVIPHSTKSGIWGCWTEGCNHLKRALAPAAPANGGAKL